jgi:hypothetical protein
VGNSNIPIGASETNEEIGLKQSCLAGFSHPDQETIPIALSGSESETRWGDDVFHRINVQHCEVFVSESQPICQSLFSIT